MRTGVFGGIIYVLCLSAFVSVAAEPSVSNLTAELKSPDDMVRLAAIDALGQKREQAADSVSALIAFLKDPSPVVRAHAVKSLGQIGAKTRSGAVQSMIVPELTPLISDTDETVRRMVVSALYKIHPSPQVSIPIFVKVMEDPDPAVRIRAMRALTASGKEAVPFMIEALKNEKAAYWAALVLNRIGPEAQDAVPALTELLGDKRPQVRREAVLALAEIGNSAAPAVPLLVKAMDNEIDRPAAVYALGRIGAPTVEGEKKISLYLDSPDKFLAELSIWALARLHPEDKQLAHDAAEALFEGLKSDDPGVRKASARALAELKLGPEIALPIMGKTFAGADENAIHGALDALAGLGPAAVPQLIESLKYESIRPYVVYMLGQNGPAAKPAVDALAKLIGDNNPDVQHEALIALAKIGPNAKTAVPILIKTLEQYQGSVCCAGTYALGSIGPDAKEASAAIAKNLDSNDETLAMLSAWALANIQGKDVKTAEKVVPILIRALANPDAKFRRGAADALKNFGPLAKSAVPALKNGLQDEDEAVRKKSAEALKSIGA
jgi:HEAT repeat protein